MPPIERTTSAPDADRGPKAARCAHWLVTVIFAAGLVLRVLTQVAYRPALLYIDSARYLAGPASSEPEGYRVMLRLLDPLGGLALVAAVQHVFGLATAVTLYALLIRRGVPRWGAALAAAPVLLDAYQLQLEQTVMPDVLFETMIAAGLVLLLWHRRPGPRLIAAGALVLGAATTVREIGAVLIAPTVIFALTRPEGRRRAALAAVCFALPVLAYLAAALAVYGHFGLNRRLPRTPAAILQRPQRVRHLEPGRGGGLLRRRAAVGTAVRRHPRPRNPPYALLWQSVDHPVHPRAIPRPEAHL